ncbi:YlmC/YmxH family sporulation protein [Youxingia wuxianensis]|uniref:YlmC/YmxH family sporulation protein n=1 Tax=Youxingia wuxianensis TaxID=2763678 RepID=A0A926EM90_9FIRM|nr:YlmC/YmxH family sporulation protein [Youxingia wuxianensis]MBC8584286.1 YlmC/YmxH family sporulation protein [Youxingia wuxianensis]
MYCRISDLKNKYVINVRNGAKIGYVGDVEVDTSSAKIISLVVYGRLRFFGLFGREEDVTIKWEDIEVIGEDTILVNHPFSSYASAKKSKGFFDVFTED